MHIQESGGIGLSSMRPDAFVYLPFTWPVDRSVLFQRRGITFVFVSHRTDSLSTGSDASNSPGSIDLATEPGCNVGRILVGGTADPSVDYPDLLSVELTNEEYQCWRAALECG